MPRRRDSKGKFLMEEDEPATMADSRRGLREEIDFSARICWLLWRMVPIILLLILFFNYFKVMNTVTHVLIETACGEGCSCACPNQPPHPPSAPSPGVGKKDPLA